MKANVILTVFIAIIISKFAYSQTTDCLSDFDFLVKKIQATYPGYNDKVTNENRSQLLLLEKEIRRKITQHPDSCSHYLNEYTAFFKDHHLSVRRIWQDNNQQPEMMEISTYGKNLYVNIDSLQQATKDAKGIEGVWEGFRQKFIVVRDGQKLVGVVVNNRGWESGQVLYEFEATNDTVFDVINHSLVKGRNPRKTKASLHVNGKIIEFHDETRFIRKSDSDILDKATLRSYVPLFPNGLNTYPIVMFLDDSTFFLRIPSFGDDESNEVVIQHWDEIMKRPNLIIDIRNNGGGQDTYYQELAKLIYTKPYESKGVEWYASKDNIILFEDGIKKGTIRDGEEGLKWTQALLDAMKKNVGGFVTHPYYANDNTMVTKDTVYPMPRNIGIIINERVGSSAEQFLLAAKESDKVILFGNSNTAGVLDYSNMVATPFPSNNFQLWYPMTRSKRLSENPIDNIGIAPDVMIPFPATRQLFDKLDSWVYFVSSYLELVNAEKRK
ncbi:MAG: S41 family peptidase [Bacteroidales bacterium]|nr:S41 family peptidase [Bacteroidales bacterium]